MADKSQYMIVARVQTVIEFDEVMGADGDPVELEDNPEFTKRRKEFLDQVENLGFVDVEHEDYY